MPTISILKRKSAEAMIPGGLDFVLTMLSPTPGKGEDHACIRQSISSFNPH